MISLLWDRLDPGFFAPIWLLVGLVAVIAIVLLEIGAHRHRRQAVKMFVASPLVATLTASVSPWKRLLKSALLTSAVGLLFIAMARPHLLYDWTEETRSGLDVLLVVDCSKSMLTEDVKPSRLERAKLAISDFADHLPDNRLGLIAFAGDAFLECPLTLDHDAFQAAVRDLDTDTLPVPGTDIAAAIEQADDALRSQPNNFKFMILVTDGEDLEGRAIQAAKNAAQNGVKIFTVGVGTPEGDRIPERDDSGAIQYHRDVNGQEVVSRLDEPALRQIAEITGGAYAPLGQRGEGLQEIYDRYIAPLSKQNNAARREKIPIERFEWPLSLAILFLMWEFLFRDRAKTPAVQGLPVPAGSARSTRRKNRAPAATVPLVALGSILPLLPSATRASDATNAERAYKSQQYDEAMQDYQKAVEKDPSRADLEYNSGDAAYRAGDYLEAEEAFRKALETPDLDLQERAYYNLGNAQYEHGQAMMKVDSDKTIALWEQALHSYDSALKLKTTADAKHNYAYVKKMLDELKKQQHGKGNQQNQSNSNSDQNQSGQGSQQNQPNQNQPQGSGQNSPQQQQQQQGQKSGGDDKTGQGQGGQQQKQSDSLKTYSGTRPQDVKDPEIKSRQEAENLLDSLKEGEHRITARSFYGDNETPPPPPSGKDW